MPACLYRQSDSAGNRFSSIRILHRADSVRFHLIRHPDCRNLHPIKETNTEGLIAASDDEFLNSTHEIAPGGEPARIERCRFALAGSFQLLNDPF